MALYTLGALAAFAFLIAIGMAIEKGGIGGDAAPANDSMISMAEFSALRTGMSYGQVTDIIGGPGVVLSESDLAGTHTIMYQWNGEGGTGANANAMFQNDQLVQKAQFGLE